MGLIIKKEFQVNLLFYKLNYRKTQYIIGRLTSGPELGRESWTAGDHLLRWRWEIHAHVERESMGHGSEEKGMDGDLALEEERWRLGV